MLTILLFILFPTLCFAGKYYSQCGQDQFVHENYFPYQKGGIFIDIGAHDGKSLSNTLFFEEQLEWTGICIEPNPSVFEELKKNRKALCLEGCVSNRCGTDIFLKVSGGCEMFSGLLEKIDPPHLQRIQSEILAQGGDFECIEVNCFTLNEILQENNITHVHFLSIDTEGGEFDIIENIDFSKYVIDVITVENNFNDERFVPFLTNLGYQHVKTLLQDMVFVRSELCTPKKQRVALYSFSWLLWPLENQSFFHPNHGLTLETYPLKFNLLRKEFELIPIYNMQNYLYMFSDSRYLKKIIFFEHWDQSLNKLPHAKTVLFKWEAQRIPEHYYDPFSRVYTIDDEIIDNEKYFKFYYPALRPMIEELIPFENKKLCTMVVSNWYLKERTDWIDFFESTPKGEFEFYGANPERGQQMYRGRINGHLYGMDKINALKNYRFCICFENSQMTEGYITEKIFDAFAAGCIPIYWGPDNITDYVPKSCFIDYRDFKTKEGVYQFIKSMNKETYENYIENIKVYLKSEKAQLFSPENFDRILYEAAQF